MMKKSIPQFAIDCVCSKRNYPPRLRLVGLVVASGELREGFPRDYHAPSDVTHGDLFPRNQPIQ